MQKRTKIIKLALTEEEYEKLATEAKETGLRLAVMCRCKALGKSTNKAPKVNIKLYRLLRNISGNLNQIARYLNSGNQIDSSLRQMIFDTNTKITKIALKAIEVED